MKPPFEINQPIEGAVVAKVIESKHTDFDAADFVFGSLKWKEYQVSNGEGLRKVDADAAPLSAYLGILGMTGLTAYMGLSEIGKLQEGETVVEGFDHIPQAFLDLFEGRNKGKMVVKM
jgi:NADPH-dependent curcumin reductase CurA